MWLKRLEPYGPGLHRFLHRAWHYALWMLALLGVLYVLAQQFFPAIRHYKPEIEARLTSTLGAPVTIRELTAEWQGVEPELRLNGIAIHDPASPANVLLEVPFVKVEPSLWESLRRLSWRLNVRVDGLSVHVREQSGHWAVKELEPLGASSPDSARQALRWCLRQAEWHFRDLGLVLTPEGRPALLFTGLDLVNRNHGDLHRLRLAGRVDGLEVRARADLTFLDPFAPEAITGKAWASLPVRDWLPWTPALPEGWRLTTLRTGGQLWLSREKNGTAPDVLLKIAVLDAGLSTPRGVRQLEGVQGLVHVRADGPEGWTVDAQALSGQLDARPIPLARLAISREHERYRVLLADADAGGLARAAANSGALPARVTGWLADALPEGGVPAASVEFTGGDAPALIAAAARFSRMGARATRDTPGMTGASGWVDYRGGVGVAALSLRNGSLDLRQAFREPVAIGELTARLSFRHQGAGWLLQSDRLRLANADANADALLSLWLPDGDPGGAELQLTADLRDGRMSSVWRYVPWPSAGDETLAWLRQSLRQGVVRQGAFLYQGLLVDRPGSPPSLMQMHFDVDSGELAYAPGWPALRNLSAGIDINNHRLEVTAHQTQVYESVARDVRADIPDLEHPVLHVLGDIDSTGSDVARLFRETPLKERAGRMLDLVSVKGEVTGKLDMTMPLADSGQTTVSVDAELPGNPVVLNEARQVDLWLSGRLHYDSAHGLSSPPMQAYFLSQPVSVRFNSVQEQGEVLALQLNVDGNVNPQALHPLLGGFSSHLKGNARYHAALTIPTNPDPLHLALASDLAGLEIALPAPLGKTAESVAPMRLDVQWDEGGDGQTVYVEQAGNFRAQAGLAHGRVQRALIRFGDGRLDDLPPAGIWVSGRMGRLDLDEWLAWWRPQHGANELTSIPLPELESFNVQLKELVYAGYRLHDCRLGAEPAGSGWRFQIESKPLSGVVVVPGGDKPLQLDVAHLLLPLESAPGTGAGVGDWSLPAMNMTIARLGLQARPALGAASFAARLTPTGTGLRLDNLALTSPDLRMQGQLEWQWRGSRRTMFNGDLQLGNIANLFSAFDYPQVLNSASGHGQVALVWQGDPNDLQADNVSGPIRVELLRGRILKLNRTVSLGRLFGVLDSDNFRRRLQFDFSDVTQKGLAFDRLTLDGSLQPGGNLQNTFSLESPSVQMRGGGRVSLASGGIDEEFDLTTPLVSAVPYAAAVVAGPLVGGALVAAETVFDDSLKKATTLHYQVRGSWESPVVERIKRPLLPLKIPFRRSAPVNTGGGR